MNCGRHLIGHLEPEGLQCVSEALRPRLGQRKAGDALDLGDHRAGDSLGLQGLADVACPPRHPCRSCHRRCRCGRRSPRLKIRSQFTTTMPASIALLRHVGHLRTVERQQHDGVHLVVDEGLDLGDLLVDVVGALDDVHLDVGQLGGDLLTLSVIAAIQPWSAAGAEKPILTIFPSGLLVTTELIADEAALVVPAEVVPAVVAPVVARPWWPDSRWWCCWSRRVRGAGGEQRRRGCSQRAGQEHAPAEQVVQLRRDDRIADRVVLRTSHLRRWRSTHAAGPGRWIVGRRVRIGVRCGRRVAAAARRSR